LLILGFQFDQYVQAFTLGKDGNPLPEVLTENFHMLRFLGNSKSDKLFAGINKVLLILSLSLLPRNENFCVSRFL